MTKLLQPRLLAAAALAAGAAPATAATPVFVNPTTPYLSSADIPVGFYFGGAPTLLDTLEDGSLDASLTGTHGVLLDVGFGGARDSVDADDGLIDGNCGPQTAGRCVSWFNGNGAEGVTFTFVGSGAMPTAFGLVWTDGGGIVTFSAVGADGQSLGSINASGFADGSFGGTTGEDRFFGVQFAGASGPSPSPTAAAASRSTTSSTAPWRRCPSRAAGRCWPPAWPGWPAASAATPPALEIRRQGAHPCVPAPRSCAPCPPPSP